MTKAQLTGGQTISAIIAGLFGNLFVTIGFTLFGLAAFGTVVLALLGLSLNTLAATVFSGEQVETVLAWAGGALGVIGIVFAVIGVVLLGMGIVISGLVLLGGKVRKPWAVTWASVGISALLSVPLFFVYVTVATSNDGDGGFILFSFLGTAITGVLIWLWMTWARRGPATEAPAIIAPPAHPAVEPPSASPAGPRSQPDG